MIINNEVETSATSSRFMCGVVEGFYGRPWTSDQRKRLFQRMNQMGMDTYLYAPKDDCKHRMYWRDLYTVEEADHLTTLIAAAEDENVTFVYALSPGLDMTYSSAKEVTCLKRKLEQVSSFGCKAFALLFDDIDVDMCEGDKEIFQSFAQAHVSVTNEVYQHLNQPEKFLFCPTEYCASRAVPDVANSEYLTTIGSKLLSGVDVMWTGPKVVSKKISIKSVEELAKVLQRPPVIWDNIHANDYDQRRLFLGPYEGRSSELIPYLRGVLTNPNCEFEANFIAMHTLAQWSKSNAGGMKKDFILSESPVSADIKLETEGEYSTDEDIPVPSMCSYQPKLALGDAIRDWLDIFYNECNPSSRKLTLVAPPINMPGVSVSTGVETCSTITNMTSALQEGLNSEVNDSYIQPTTINPVNSLVDPSSESEDESGIDILPEPMDCAASTSGASTCSSGLSTGCTDSLDSLSDDKNTVTAVSSSSTLSTITDTCPNELTLKLPGNKEDVDASSIETMQVDCDVSSPPIGYNLNENLSNPAEIAGKVMNNIPPMCSPPFPDNGLEDPSCIHSMCSVTEERLSENDVQDLVELFYMPFEHGGRGIHLLNEFHWLKVSAICLCNGSGSRATPEQKSAAAEWRARADEFCSRLDQLFAIFRKFACIPNKALLYDLFPYVWDMTVVMNQLATFVGWLALGQVPYSGMSILRGSPYSWSSIKFREHFSSGDQEPWVFRGGLQAEFQRLLPLEGAPDLLMMSSPPFPSIGLHKVRPYRHTDEAAVYEVCRKTCDDGIDGTEIFPDQPDLIGDKLVGGFLNISPTHCFVIENDLGAIIGYVLAAPDTADFHKKMEMAWLPLMREKYPKPTKEEDLSPAEEIISSFYNQKTTLPHDISTRHPALVRMDLLPESIQDPTTAKRGMASLVATLKIRNIHGIHTEIHVGDHNTTEFYSKLGFIDIPLPDVAEDLMFMGRLI